MKVYLLILSILLLPAVLLATNEVDINTATLEELDQIAGIGPKYAQAIIDARPFSSVDDLVKVKGIGEKTLGKIKEQGLACVSCSQNSEEVRPPEPPPSGGEASLSSEKVGPPTTYPGGVFINEVMPSPEGADEDKEWIELYNSNNFDVDLSGWKIQDTTGTKTIYNLPQNTIIPTYGFLVFTRPETKITLNNDQDTINLLAPDNKIASSVSYPKAQLNQSYSKISSVWQWSTTPTPRAKNTAPQIQTKNPSTGSEANGLPKQENSDKNKIAESGLASLNQTTNPWFLFFTALAITIISATTVLFIKIKFKSNVRT